MIRGCVTSILRENAPFQSWKTANPRAEGTRCFTADKRTGREMWAFRAFSPFFADTSRRFCRRHRSENSQQNREKSRKDCFRCFLNKSASGYQKASPGKLGFSLSHDSENKKNAFFSRKHDSRPSAKIICSAQFLRIMKKRGFAISSKASCCARFLRTHDVVCRVRNSSWKKTQKLLYSETAQFRPFSLYFGSGYIQIFSSRLEKRVLCSCLTTAKTTENVVFR